MYRYTAFGQTLEDTATANLDQPLRWKGRWHSLVGGAEIYDVWSERTRARGMPSLQAGYGIRIPVTG